MTMRHANEDQLRTMIESAAHAVLFADAQGKIQFYNGAATELFAYESDELFGLEVQALIPAALGLDEAETPNNMPENQILAFSGLTLDVPAVRKDGTQFVTEVTIAEAETAGVPVYTLVLRDITARIANESERQRLQLQLASAHKLESVGRLAAGVAHEINTPTQYVGDNLEFLRESVDALRNVLAAYRSAARMDVDSDRCAAVNAADALAKKLDLDYLDTELPLALEQAVDGITQIGSIVSAMKGFCHPGLPDKQPVDLNSVIENTVSVSRNEWKYVAHVELELHESLPLVSCNENEIKQVILNLIVNAAQAIEEQNGTGSGIQGHIRIETRSSDQYVEIEISDDGPGISAKAMPRLFDPFFTTKGVGKGTGQGLAIAQSVLTDRHDGELVVQSQPGEGARFVMRLPR
tara:strand:+ start:20398 stop:21624 length:1227 start_codon:yes stop_codon:yes gene_type:complete